MQTNPAPASRTLYDKYFSDLSLAQKNNVIIYMQFFVRQFLPAIGLPTPYFVVLDNSLVQDLLHSERKPDRMVRARAVKCMLEYFSHRLPFPIYIAATPITLYEHIGKRSLKDIADFENTTDSLKILLKQLNLPVMLFRINHFDEANDNIARIIWDNEQVLRAIKSIKEQKYQVRFSEESDIMTSLQTAYKFVPTLLTLRYVNKDFARFVLASVVEVLIWNSPGQKKELRKKFFSIENAPAAEIAKIKGGDLKGLGDIQIADLCSIRSQFTEPGQFSFVALTADESLFKLFQYFYSWGRSSDILTADAVKDMTSLENFKGFWLESMIDEKNNKACNQLYREFHSFLFDINQYLLDEINQNISAES